MKSTVVCTWLLLIAACADAGPIPAPPEGYGFAYATPSCGPADGPAVRLYLAAAATESLPPAGTWLDLAVWRSATELPAAELSWSGASDLGWAGRCTDAGPCETATDVRISFRRFEPDSALTGTLDLRFENGSRVAGGFRATWRPATPLCG